METDDVVGAATGASDRCRYISSSRVGLVVGSGRTEQVTPAIVTADPPISMISSRVLMHRFPRVSSSSRNTGRSLSVVVSAAVVDGVGVVEVGLVSVVVGVVVVVGVSGVVGVVVDVVVGAVGDVGIGVAVDVVVGVVAGVVVDVVVGVVVGVEVDAGVGVAVDVVVSDVVAAKCR